MHGTACITDTHVCVQPHTHVCNPTDECAIFYALHEACVYMNESEHSPSGYGSDGGCKNKSEICCVSGSVSVSALWSSRAICGPCRARSRGW